MKSLPLQTAQVGLGEQGPGHANAQSRATCFQRSGQLGNPLGDRLEQCQDGSTAQPKCQEQLPHRPTDSTERKKGLHTTPFVHTEQNFYRLEEETSVSRARQA